MTQIVLLFNGKADEAWAIRDLTLEQARELAQELHKTSDKFIRKLKKQEKATLAIDVDYERL